MILQYVQKDLNVKKEKYMDLRKRIYSMKILSSCEIQTNFQIPGGIVSHANK